MKKDKKNIPINELNKLQDEYIKELDANTEFSLFVDPENKYNMDALQKKFIEYYCEFKNVNTAADLSGIDMNTARDYFVAYNTQQEIKRINRAMYHRQFGSKLLTVDEIGGYLTALIKDEVPYGDRLTSRDKLKVAQMIIDLNELKAESLIKPEILVEKDIEEKIKNLSIEAISALLEQSNNNEEKSKLVNEINSDLTNEEKDYLKTLSTDELLQILNGGANGK